MNNLDWKKSRLPIELPAEFGPSLKARLQQLIADEMPAGSHRARAHAWAALARRCDRASLKHLECAERAEATLRQVERFAPAYRQAVVDFIKAGGKIKLTDTATGQPYEGGVTVTPEMSPAEFARTLDGCVRDAALEKAAAARVAAEIESEQQGAAVREKQIQAFAPKYQSAARATLGPQSPYRLLGWDEAQAAGRDLRCTPIKSVPFEPTRRPGLTARYDYAKASCSTYQDPPADGSWRWLTPQEHSEGQVWTGRIYRDLTDQEQRDARTAEPTDALEPGSETP